MLLIPSPFVEASYTSANSPNMSLQRSCFSFGWSLLKLWLQMKHTANPLVGGQQSACLGNSLDVKFSSKVRQFLSQANAKTLFHASITCRTAYCNAPLSGLPRKKMSQFQLLQNFTARMLMETRKRAHITPVLSLWIGCQNLLGLILRFFYCFFNVSMVLQPLIHLIHF